MENEIRILFVDDNLDDVFFAQASLKRAGMIVESRIVQDEQELTEQLTNWHPHIVVSDLALPAFSGLAAFDVAKRVAPSTPFLFLSGGARGRLVSGALARGASGYIEKGDEASFVALVKSLLGQKQTSPRK